MSNVLRYFVRLLAVWLTILLGMTNVWAVMLSPTSAQLAVTPNPAMAGQTVTLTMTVTGTNPAAPPTGQVTFKEGLAVLGSVNLNNGVAALNTQFNTAGIHGVTATYAGDGSNGGTSRTTWFTITAAATTTQLVPSANPARPDQAVTLTATVTGVNPTGTVTFKNGNTLLGSALLTAGTASITRTFGAVGNYPLTAGYNGDTNNLASTSSPLTLTVSIEPQVYYIHTDHLDTPREITDTAGNVVWQWDNTDPFGANAPNENPNGVGQFSFNLRFAGQYHDRETGLNYNVNRDYSPVLGRYLESDPIGLIGGINTYTYVGGNPLIRIDPTGEFWPWKMYQCMKARDAFEEDLKSCRQEYSSCGGDLKKEIEFIEKHGGGGLDSAMYNCARARHPGRFKEMIETCGEAAAYPPAVLPRKK